MQTSPLPESTFFFFTVTPSPQQGEGRGGEKQTHVSETPFISSSTPHEPQQDVSFATMNFVNTSDNFMAGKTCQFINNWKLLTSDSTILSWVQRVKIDFTEGVFQHHCPLPLVFSGTEKLKMQAELDNLEKKSIIEPAHFNSSQFISNIFFRPKKDGLDRIILNLKALNQSVEYHHFKMETLHNAIALMVPGCYMASVDLADAYYSIPVHSDHRNFLRFLWEGRLYQFTCLPNGLAEAQRKFTKLLKVPFSELRKSGFINSSYIDDSYLQGDTFEDCLENVHMTVAALDKLGFTVHQTKSVFTPSQTLVFLGLLSMP